MENKQQTEIEKIISNYPYHLRTATGIPIEVNVKGLAKEILDLSVNECSDNKEYGELKIRIGERYTKLLERAKKYKDNGATRRYAILLLKNWNEVFCEIPLPEREIKDIIDRAYYNFDLKKEQ